VGYKVQHLRVISMIFFQKNLVIATLAWKNGRLWVVLSYTITSTNNHNCLAGCLLLVVLRGLNIMLMGHCLTIPLYVSCVLALLALLLSNFSTFLLITAQEYRRTLRACLRLIISYCRDFYHSRVFYWSFGNVALNLEVVYSLIFSNIIWTVLKVLTFWKMETNRMVNLKL